MSYHVTLTTKDDKQLTAEIGDSETLESTLRWIERLRSIRCEDPVLYWITLEGYHWCLVPAEIVGDPQVLELQPVETAVS